METLIFLAGILLELIGFWLLLAKSEGIFSGSGLTIYICTAAQSLTVFLGPCVL